MELIPLTPRTPHTHSLNLTTHTTHSHTHWTCWCLVDLVSVIHLQSNKTPFSFFFYFDLMNRDVKILASMIFCFCFSTFPNLTCVVGYFFYTFTYCFHIGRVILCVCVFTFWLKAQSVWIWFDDKRWLKAILIPVLPIYYAFPPFLNPLAPSVYL